MDLAGQSTARTAHVLLTVPRDAGPMLVHSHDRGIDHLHSRFMSGGQRLHDLVPNAGPPPTDKTVVAGRAGTIDFRQIPPRRARAQDQKMPLRTRRSATRGMPRGLFGSIGLMTLHSQ